MKKAVLLDVEYKQNNLSIIDRIIRGNLLCHGDTRNSIFYAIQNIYLNNR